MPFVVCLLTHEFCFVVKSCPCLDRKKSDKQNVGGGRRDGEIKGRIENNTGPRGLFADFISATRPGYPHTIMSDWKSAAG